MRRLLSMTLLMLVPIGLLLSTPMVWADPVHLDHDASGQLLRVVPEQSNGVRFQHDAAGNIVAVLHDLMADSPRVTEQSAERFRCGQVTEITVIGDGLDGALPHAVDGGLTFSDVRYGNGALRFRILADCDGIQGDTAVRLQTASGDTLLPLAVDPQRPLLIVRPSPMAVMPGGGLRGFEIVLSHADTRAHEIALSVPDTHVASLDSDAVMTIQAGETRAFGVIQGIAPGTTVLRLEAPDLGSVSVPLLVTESAAGVNTLLAQPLGMALPADPGATPSLTITLHQGLGVAAGRGLLALEPSILNRDDGEKLLRLTMQAMGAVTGHTIHPGDGIDILSARRLDPETLELQIRIAESAAVGLRQLRIADEQGVAPALRPGADRLLLAHGHPLIHSVSPNRLRLGDSGVLLTLRGEHLDDALAVEAEPGAGIELGAPTVTDAGSRVQTLVSVAPDAEPGPRRLQLRTPGATTDGAASPANTLHLVTDAGPLVDTLSAHAVGIQLQGGGDPGGDGPTSGRLAAFPLGIVAGPHLMGIQPDVLVPGMEHGLTLSGRGFHAGHTATLIPDQGVAGLEFAGIAADGSAAELHIALADDAMLGSRRLRIVDGHGVMLPPAFPGADQVRITPAGARIDSVSPLYLPRGVVTEVLVRGEKLQDVQAVTLQPGDGVVAEPAQVMDDGRALWLRLAVAAEAELGPRQLLAETLTGRALAASNASNTLYVTDQAEPPALALHDALLGLDRVVSPADGEDAAVAVTESSPPLGVRRLFTEAELPGMSAESLAAALGLNRAPALLRIAPDTFRPGQTATVALTGLALDQVSSVSVVPTDGITADALTVGEGGGTLDVEVTIAGDAAAGMRQLQLRSEDGVRVSAGALADRILIGPGTPRIDSLSPILAGRGDAGTLLIRGERLQLVSEIRVIGDPGLRLGAFWESNPDGTELAVNYAVDRDAPRGERSIQLVVPGDQSSAEASPANTFTVHDEVPD